ncbi:AarF/ABC1/UbiB kinase family protein [Nocardia sp. 2]|uniref:AarF/ABC1/UbiB kinase family protein n=1 Tax=Nocardia acididurans TaxID=2802282 RepID=A0ABS1MFT5_9NOCA|nr:AarF/ABC1/UbiB kinase family protein [Nocardia acididurans]MBL1078925.1 AarF/ABC1/UbiB kinase family protein [Nocardia acididurans]
MPTSRIGRDAKIASLPVAYAGRRAAGLGKRMIGRSAADIERDIQVRTAEHLVDVLGELKGCAAKLGQMASVYRAMIPTVIPEDFAEVAGAALARLQDSAPPMMPGLVQQVLVRGFGPEWRTRFRSFDDRPAAAASLGQVHRAVWHDGRRVAVKIMYPGARDAVDSDLRQLRSLSGMIGALMPGADVQGIIEMVCSVVGDELDYHREADYQQRASDMVAAGTEFVVPQVIMCTDEIIVSEWIDGTPVTRLITSTDTAERSRVGIQIIRFVETLREHCRLLYSDVHPGNFLVLPDGRLAVVDFGACEQYPEGFPRMVGDIADPLFNAGPAELEAVLRRHGFVRPEQDFDVEELLRIVSPFLDVLLEPDFRLSQEWLRAQAVAILEIRLSNVFRQMTLPPHLTAMARTIGTTLGLLCQLGTDGVRDELLSWWVEIGRVVRAYEERVAAGRARVVP